MRVTTRPTGNLKHSPGPWSDAGQFGAVLAPNLTDKDQSLIQAYGGPPVCESISNKADRTLIIAAPQMLQSLARVLDSPHEPDKWRRDAEKAFCEATGMPTESFARREVYDLVHEAMQPFARPEQEGTRG